jgi:hypothetical protein
VSNNPLKFVDPSGFQRVVHGQDAKGIEQVTIYEVRPDAPIRMPPWVPGGQGGGGGGGGGGMGGEHPGNGGTGPYPDPVNCDPDAGRCTTPDDVPAGDGKGGRGRGGTSGNNGSGTSAPPTRVGETPKGDSDRSWLGRLYDWFNQKRKEIDEREAVEKALYRCATQRGKYKCFQPDGTLITFDDPPPRYTVILGPPKTPRGAGEIARKAGPLTREAQKAISSLEKQIAKHEQKLADFRATRRFGQGWRTFRRT